MVRDDGVGGFAKALRTIPEVLGSLSAFDAVVPRPDLNFTNPSGMVTEALTRRGIERVVGLCNVPIEMYIEIAKVLGRSVSEVTLTGSAHPHLGWVRRVLVDGRDVPQSFWMTSKPRSRGRRTSQSFAILPDFCVPWVRPRLTFASFMPSSRCALSLKASRGRALRR